MKLVKDSLIRLRRQGDTEWCQGIVVLASENGVAVAVQLEDGGAIRTADGGVITGMLPLVVDPEAGTLHDLVTATPLEIEVAEKVARFELSPTQFPVLLEALHPVTRQVVWSQRIETPGVVAIPALSSQLGHPVAMRATYADGRVEEHDPPPGRPTIH